MVKDRVDNLLSKTSTDRHGAKIRLWYSEENLLVVIAVNNYNAIRYVTTKHIQAK